MTEPKPFLREMPGPKNNWVIDWYALEQFPFARDLEQTPQDPRWHAEGDVWAHTCMVLKALVEMEEWRMLPPHHREDLFWAALLHDIAKPFCTKTDEDGIHSPGHAGKGAIEARRILWEMGYPFHRREAVCGLIQEHIKPFFILEGDETRKVIAISQHCRCDHLALLALADTRGRTCAAEFTRDGEDLVGLFLMVAESHGCLSRPYPFTSNHSRFLYFRLPDRNHLYEAFDDTRCTVVVMSGLPGAGKDTWIKNHFPDLPMISLDDIRREQKIKPGDKKAQGRVAQEAQEMLKVHLRAGQDCVWNATNLSRDVRGKVLSILADYNARVRIAHIEAPYNTLRRQNLTRENSVPLAVIEKLTRRWQMPDLTEAHTVTYVTGET